MSTDIVVGYDENQNPVTISGNYSIHQLGVPGVGKSHLTLSIANQAHLNGEGVLVMNIKDEVEPRELAGRASKPEDVIYVGLGMAPKGYTWGINMLEGDQTLVVDQILEMFDRTDVFDRSMTQVEQHLTMGIWLALQEDKPTLRTILQLLTYPKERRRLLEIAARRRRTFDPNDPIEPLDQDVIEFWEYFDSQSKSDWQNNRDQRQQVESTLVRLRKLLTGQPIASVLSHPENTFLLSQWLDEGKMVICDLVTSPRGMPMRQSRDVANVIIAMFVGQAITRNITPDSRPWRLIADEFDILASDTFIHSIDKLRSKKIIPVMIHQNLDQISNKKLHASLISQPIKLYFRTSPTDRPSLGRFIGHDMAREVTQLPKRHVRVIQPNDEEEPEAIPSRFSALHQKKPVAIDLGGKTVQTYDWWAPFSEEQYQEIVRRSFANTRPTHGSMEGYDHDLFDSSLIYGDEDEAPEDPEGGAPGASQPPTSPEPAGSTPGSHPRIEGYPAGTRQASFLDEHPGGPPPVSGEAEQPQQGLHAGGGAGQSEPLTETPVRGRVDRAVDGVPDTSQLEDGQAGADARQHPDQAGGTPGQTNPGGTRRRSGRRALDA